MALLIPSSIKKIKKTLSKLDPPDQSDKTKGKPWDFKVVFLSLSNPVLPKRLRMKGILIKS